MYESRYGVATISRMLKNIGLFCQRDLQKRPIFCKETYIFKHPTNRSHPIHESSASCRSKRESLVCGTQYECGYTLIMLHSMDADTKEPLN